MFLEEGAGRSTRYRLNRTLEQKVATIETKSDRFKNHERDKLICRKKWLICRNVVVYVIMIDQRTSTFVVATMCWSILIGQKNLAWQ